MINSTINCINGNTTLQEIISVNQVNASNVSHVLNSTAYSLEKLCEWGCDNITATCSPAPIVQSIAAIGIFLAFCFILIAIWKWG